MTTKQRILIIDQDGMAAKLATQMFEAAGYDVFVAGNGVHGLSQAKSIRPDLIILDAMVPGLSAVEVCRRLRSDPDTAPTPIILRGTKGSLEGKLEASEVGADDYLQSPVSPDELLERASVFLWQAD
jgi:DNA-binding response OmpR family regulator